MWWESRHHLLQYVLPYVSPASTRWKAHYNQRHPKSEWQHSTRAEPNIDIMCLLSGSARKKVQNNYLSQNCLMNHGPEATAVGLKRVTHIAVKKPWHSVLTELKHTPSDQMLNQKLNKLLFKCAKIFSSKNLCAL